MKVHDDHPLGVLARSEAIHEALAQIARPPCDDVAHRRSYGVLAGSMRSVPLLTVAPVLPFSTVVAAGS